MSVRATNFVRRLRGLSPEEKAVAFVLADHDSHKGDGSYPSMKTVAMEAGLKNRETASRITKRLVQKKIFLSDEPSKREQGRPTVYRLNYSLETCDSPVTGEHPRTCDSPITPPVSEPVTRDCKPVTLEPQTCDSPVTQRVEGKFKRKGKSSLRNAAEPTDDHGLNGDRLDDFKKRVLAKCEDPAGDLAIALDVIVERVRRSGVNVTSQKYLEVALERFDFQAGQDREDWMAASRGRTAGR
jgi:hypothetical protein